MNPSHTPESPEDDNGYTEEQMDWYFPGRRKGPRQSPQGGDSGDKPGRFQTMVQKLHIGTTLAALFLFFLPWLDIQCSGTSFATQSGVQNDLWRRVAIR